MLAGNNGFVRRLTMLGDKALSAVVKENVSIERWS
jgi:hypothetical protein